MLIRLATRGSALALWQANRAADLIRTAAPASRVELITVSTCPDRSPDQPLHDLGGDKGLFVREVEQAILDGRADAAVHSLKDVPLTDLATGLRLCAFPERADPRDVLLSRGGVPLQGLPHGAAVGTSALRRQGQALRARPDLSIAPVRGNVDTRIAKLRDGQFDALIMAAAGISRLGLEDEISQWLDFEAMLPAPGQGIIAVEAPEDSQFAEVWGRIDNPAIRQQAEAERAFARLLGADCRSAVGCIARANVGSAPSPHAQFRAMVCSPDGREYLHHQSSGSGTDLMALAETAARDLLNRGAAKILEG